MGIKQEKTLLRQKIKQLSQKESDEYRKESDIIICNQVIHLCEFQKAETIFCFVGSQAEIDTRPILLESLKQGKRLGVPRCIGSGIMEVYEITSLDQLEVGNYQIMEPHKDCNLIPIEEIDFAVIPCMTCTVKGERLGHGGGYYDRYLESGGFITCLICRESMIQSVIPIEPHDKRMDIVITESGTFYSQKN